MPTPSAPVHLAVALDGCGWHPAAWRELRARPRHLSTAGYWVDQIAEAERGLLDFVTLEDSLGWQSTRANALDGRTDQVRGRLDAVLIAARVAPATRQIGLIPSVNVTHTEPFHVSKAIATLDYVSSGRAGVRVQASARPYEAALFGRRTFPEPPTAGEAAPGSTGNDLLDEAADYVEVLRRLWDSWEDDAEIRDAASGRFVDRDKLHYIDFQGRWFQVRGPSITPRPPQGQPVVSALAHQEAVYRLAGRAADVVYVTPTDPADAAAIVARVRAGQAAAGREADTVHVLGDVVAFVDTTERVARARKLRLDELAGRELRSDAAVFVGTPADLADLVAIWQRSGLSGVRVRPGCIPHDLEAVSRGLVPALQERGLFRRAYQPGSLRSRLGLSRPANRYVPVQLERRP